MEGQVDRFKNLEERGREGRGSEAGRKQAASIHWLTPQMPAVVGAEPKSGA